MSGFLLVRIVRFLMTFHVIVISAIPDSVSAVCIDKTGHIGVMGKCNESSNDPLNLSGRESPSGTNFPSSTGNETPQTHYYPDDGHPTQMYYFYGRPTAGYSDEHPSTGRYSNKRLYEGPSDRRQAPMATVTPTATTSPVVVGGPTGTETRAEAATGGEGGEMVSATTAAVMTDILPLTTTALTGQTTTTTGCLDQQNQGRMVQQRSHEVHDEQKTGIDQEASLPQPTFQRSNTLRRSTGSDESSESLADLKRDFASYQPRRFTYERPPFLQGRISPPRISRKAQRKLSSDGSFTPFTSGSPHFTSGSHILPHSPPLNSPFGSTVSNSPDEIQEGNVMTRSIISQASNEGRTGEPRAVSSGPPLTRNMSQNFGVQSGVSPSTFGMTSTNPSRLGVYSSVVSSSSPAVNALALHAVCPHGYPVSNGVFQNHSGDSSSGYDGSLNNPGYNGFKGDCNGFAGDGRDNGVVPPPVEEIELMDISKIMREDTVTSREPGDGLSKSLSGWCLIEARKNIYKSKEQLTRALSVKPVWFMADQTPVEGLSLIQEAEERIRRQFGMLLADGMEKSVEKSTTKSVESVDSTAIDWNLSLLLQSLSVPELLALSAASDRLQFLNGGLQLNRGILGLTKKLSGVKTNALAGAIVSSAVSDDGDARVSDDGDARMDDGDIDMSSRESSQDVGDGAANVDSRDTSVETSEESTEATDSMSTAQTPNYDVDDDAEMKNGDAEMKNGDVFHKQLESAIESECRCRINSLLEAWQKERKVLRNYKTFEARSEVIFWNARYMSSELEEYGKGRVDSKNSTQDIHESKYRGERNTNRGETTGNNKYTEMLWRIFGHSQNEDFLSYDLHRIVAKDDLTLVSWLLKNKLIRHPFPVPPRCDDEDDERSRYGEERDDPTVDPKVGYDELQKPEQQTLANESLPIPNSPSINTTETSWPPVDNASSAQGRFRIPSFAMSVHSDYLGDGTRQTFRSDGLHTDRGHRGSSTHSPMETSRDTLHGCSRGDSVLQAFSSDDSTLENVSKDDATLLAPDDRHTTQYDAVIQTSPTGSFSDPDATTINVISTHFTGSFTSQDAEVSVLSPSQTGFITPSASAANLLQGLKISSPEGGNTPKEGNTPRAGSYDVHLDIKQDRSTGRDIFSYSTTSDIRDSELDDQSVHGRHLDSYGRELHTFNTGEERVGEECIIGHDPREECISDDPRPGCDAGDADDHHGHDEDQEDNSAETASILTGETDENEKAHLTVTIGDYVNRLTDRHEGPRSALSRSVSEVAENIKDSMMNTEIKDSMIASETLGNKASCLFGDGRDALSTAYRDECSDGDCSTSTAGSDSPSRTTARELSIQLSSNSLFGSPRDRHQESASFRRAQTSSPPQQSVFPRTLSGTDLKSHISSSQSGTPRSSRLAETMRGRVMEASFTGVPSRRAGFALATQTSLLRNSPAGTSRASSSSQMPTTTPVDSPMNSPFDSPRYVIETRMSPPLTCAAHQNLPILVSTIPPLDVRDSKNETPLLIAASMGLQEMIALLIQAGANIDELDSLGYSPLMRATTKGYKQIVAQLVNAGARLDHRSYVEGFETEDGRRNRSSSNRSLNNRATKHFLGACQSGRLEDRGETAIEIAQRTNHIEIVNMLGGYE